METFFVRFFAPCNGADPIFAGVYPGLLLSKRTHLARLYPENEFLPALAGTAEDARL